MFNNNFSWSKILCSVLILFGGYNLYASVAFSPMRGLTKKQFVWDMKAGWNLGNTMDMGTETSAGNPMTTQAMLDAVHTMGFKTLREPVTWNGHFGAAPTYTIVQAWLDRVVAIANYALNDSMYVIVNTHHDGWYNLSATTTTNPSVATITAEVATLWTQIANAFKNYSDYVVFEIFNEPNAGAPNQYNGGDPTSRANLAAYQLAAVNAIRATGGNNATRMIMLQGISASPLAVSIGTIPIPDSNILVSIHTYDPLPFSLLTGGTTTWGSAADSAEIRTNLLNIQTWVATKGGTAIIGEWGSTAIDVLSSRVAHACYYAQQVRLKGMLPVWWDNGRNAVDKDGFALLNRTTNPPSWYFPTVAQALCNCAAAVPAAVEPEPPKENKLPPYGLMERAGAVSYSLTGAAFVSLRVYTLQGRIAATLVKANQSAGNHEVKLPAKELPFGNYVLEFKAGNTGVTKKLTVIR